MNEQFRTNGRGGGDAVAASTTPDGVASMMLGTIENAGLSDFVAPWANLAAVGLMSYLFFWVITKHQPERDKRLEERSDAKDAIFLRTLAEERQRSRDAAISGHEAAKALADNIHDMTLELRRFTNSQFHNEEHR
jgi:uncharacterized membrane protein YebE (DUF533 family)